MPTLGNLVVTPTILDSSDPVAMLTALATGFSNAIGGLGTGKRQPRRFYVTTQIQKTALAGLITLQSGDEVFVNGDKWWETFVNGAWKVTKTVVPKAWPFAASNISGDASAGSSFAYSVDGDIVSLRGTLTYANTLTWTGTGVGMALPFPCGTITSGAIPTAWTHVGTVIVRNPNNSPYPIYQGAAYIKASSAIGGTDNSTLLISIDTGASTGILVPMSNTVPLAGGFLAGCTLSIDIRYRRQ